MSDDLLLGTGLSVAGGLGMARVLSDIVKNDKNRRIRNSNAHAAAVKNRKHKEARLVKSEIKAGAAFLSASKPMYKNAFAFHYKANSISSVKDLSTKFELEGVIDTFGAWINDSDVMESNIIIATAAWLQKEGYDVQGVFDSKDVKIGAAVSGGLAVVRYLLTDMLLVGLRRNTPVINALYLLPDSKKLKLAKEDSSLRPWVSSMRQVGGVESTYVEKASLLAMASKSGFKSKNSFKLGEFVSYIDNDNWTEMLKASEDDVNAIHDAVRNPRGNDDLSSKEAAVSSQYWWCSIVASALDFNREWVAQAINNSVVEAKRHHVKGDYENAHRLGVKALLKSNFPVNSGTNYFLPDSGVNTAYYSAIVASGKLDDSTLFSLLKDTDDTIKLNSLNKSFMSVKDRGLVASAVGSVVVTNLLNTPRDFEARI